MLINFTVSFERARTVDINTDSLFLETNKSISIIWPHTFLLSPTVAIDTNNILVDIKLYEIDTTNDTVSTTREIAALAADLFNTGMANITIPDLTDIINKTIVPVSIQAEARYDISDGAGSTFSISFGLWTGKMYLRRLMTTRSQCEAWSAAQPGDIGTTILNRVSRIYPCPPTLNRVTRQNSGFEGDYLPSQILQTEAFDRIHRIFFHPGSIACYRQRGGFG